MRRRGRPAPQKGPNDLVRTFTPKEAKARSQPSKDMRWSAARRAYFVEKLGLDRGASG